ncbi:SDR family oxidoreductase [Mycetocola sp. 2940]|uniref:SDR family NAD(P)-dependent oxidoreductase n=1 Tax=Mycetocola sp. 2940 TaxID=3156452 RepID=UPI00339A590A
MNEALGGKVAIVTGGARGQGLEHSLILAREGATVYALDLLVAEGEELQRYARERNLDIRFRSHDVTDESAWGDLVASIDQEHGALDALVNNAGIVHSRAIRDESIEAFSRVLNVNVLGMFLGMKMTWDLLAVRGGSIINTSSVYGKVSAPGYAAYTASKAAVLGITRTAAIEGAPFKIRANALLPGVVETEQLKDESASYVRQSTPLRRGADAAELAKVVLFLASNDSAFITGTDFIVDGGFMAGGFSVGRD